MVHRARVERAAPVSGGEAGRPLGFWTAAALVVGFTIGVGVFLTPAEVIGAVASPALTFALWLFCGGLVLAGALTFGELSSRYPQAGGPYVFLREAWGDRAAFLYGWQSLLVMDPGVVAALSAGLSQYVVVLWPEAAGKERWVAVATIWALALLNMAGLRLSSRVIGGLTALKVVALTGVVAAALTIGSGSWSHFSPFVARRAGAVPLAEALALGLVGVFYSYGGFWEASRVAGEVRDPDRAMPRALAAGVAVVTLLYTLTAVAFLYLVPAEQATSAQAFARLAGAAILGPSGPRALSSVVVLSVATSVMALLFMAPRLYLAMARDRAFPASLASLSPRTKAPVRATALLATMASLFVLAGNFRQIVAFFMATTFVFIALTAAGLFVIRAREPGRGFRTPGYPATTALFVLLLTGVVVLLVLQQPREALTGFALVLLGVPSYALFRRSSARRVSDGIEP